MNQTDTTDGQNFDIAALAAVVRANERAHHRLDGVVRLAAWVGAGKTVTGTGVPRPADAAAAARACGLEVPDRKVTRASQVPGLIEAWGAALAAGFLELDGNRALPGPSHGAWPDGPDETVLGVWLAVFAATAGFELEEDGTMSADDDGAVTLALLDLLSRRPQSLDEMRTVLRDALPDVIGSAIAPAKVPSVGDAVDRAVGQLSDWGLADVEPARVSLTPLGLFAGYEFDVRPVEQVDPAVDAVGLLVALSAEPDRGPRAASAWLAARPALDAARQLLSAAAGATSLRRIMAVSLVQELGAAALPAWKDTARLPGIGAYARMHLWEVGVGPEPADEDAEWLAADLGASMTALGEEDLPHRVLDMLMNDAYAELDEREQAFLERATRTNGHSAPRRA
jgi:hypothetical protein